MYSVEQENGKFYNAGYSKYANAGYPKDFKFFEYLLFLRCEKIAYVETRFKKSSSNGTGLDLFNFKI